MNGSAKNCQDVLIVGEKCSRAHLRSVRGLRAHPQVKNQPYGWNSHKFLPPNMRLMTTLIQNTLYTLIIQKDLTHNILRGKPIPRPWD